MMRKLATLAALALIAAVPARAAENPCASPVMASLVISALDDMMTPAAKDRGISVVDVSDITTVAAPNDGIFACHVTAVFSSGLRVQGTFSTRRNAAGDMLTVWKPGRAYQGKRT